MKDSRQTGLARQILPLHISMDALHLFQQEFSNNKDLIMVWRRIQHVFFLKIPNAGPYPFDVMAYIQDKGCKDVKDKRKTNSKERRINKE